MKNISQIRQEVCVGCGACKNVCALSCISWEEGMDPFRYPHIDSSGCVGCGKCLSVCSVYNCVAQTAPQEGYAACLNEECVYQNSTSGGTFAGLAEYVIEKMNGYICGAVMESDLTLHHILSNNIKDIARMQGSKYVQSDMEDCFEKISKLVAEGHYVLFCGTGCQAAALKCYCGDSSFLFVLDLICHGVPSASAFKQYIRKFYTDYPVEHVTYREKNRYEDTTFALNIGDQAGKNIWIHSSKDPFYSAFLAGASYRECCYDCRFARKERCGDITIGDCANSAEYAKKLNGRVLSTVFVNNPRGLRLWNMAKSEFDYINADIDREVSLNKQLHEPVKRPAQRSSFYHDISVLNKRLLVKKYCPKENIKIRMKRFIIFFVPANVRLKIKELFRGNKK